MWANAFRDVDTVGQTETQALESYHENLKEHHLFTHKQVRFMRMDELFHKLLFSVLPAYMHAFYFRQAGECRMC